MHLSRCSIFFFEKNSSDYSILNKTNPQKCHGFTLYHLFMDWQISQNIELEKWTTIANLTSQEKKQYFY